MTGVAIAETPKSNSQNVMIDDSVFQADLARITPQLRGFARTLCGCRDRADDLAQETLLKAWSARHSFQPDTNFKAWTFTILRNLFYSEVRRARFTGEYDEEKANLTLRVSGRQEGVLELTDVLRAMQTIPEASRDALILATVGDHSYDEISQICGIAVGTVKSRICRARAQLLSVLDAGILPDSRHDFVLEGDAIDLLLAHVTTIANRCSSARLAA